MESLSTTTHRMATGFVAPYLRIATHVGYALATVNNATDDDWEVKREDIRADFREALGHIDNSYDVTPFLNESARDALVSINGNVVEIIDLDGDKTEMQEARQVLASNVAWAGALMERSVTGADVTEGTEI